MCQYSALQQCAVQYQFCRIEDNKVVLRPQEFDVLLYYRVAPGQAPKPMAPKEKKAAADAFDDLIQQRG